MEWQPRLQFQIVLNMKLTSKLAFPSIFQSQIFTLLVDCSMSHQKSHSGIWAALLNHLLFPNLFFFLHLQDNCQEDPQQVIFLIKLDSSSFLSLHHDFQVLLVIYLFSGKLKWMLSSLKVYVPFLSLAGVIIILRKQNE